jgi:hypothetical protein
VKEYSKACTVLLSVWSAKRGTGNGSGFHVVKAREGGWSLQGSTRQCGTAHSDGTTQQR